MFLTKIIKRKRNKQTNKLIFGIYFEQQIKQQQHQPQKLYSNKTLLYILFLN